MGDHQVPLEELPRLAVSTVGDEEVHAVGHRVGVCQRAALAGRAQHQRLESALLLLQQVRLESGRVAWAEIPRVPGASVKRAQAIRRARTKVNRRVAVQPTDCEIPVEMGSAQLGSEQPRARTDAYYRLKWKRR